MTPVFAEGMLAPDRLQSVVKVFTVSDAPDYEQPWQTHGPVHMSGSGVIVDTPRGPRVLTNAHCVEHHVFVQVRRYGQSRKIEAEVEALGHDSDLALLSVKDSSFFNGVAPLEIARLPRLGDPVSVLGYPIGGERLSMTQGIVSRIDLVNYAQSQRNLLAIQVDAAINSGNSGGPVLAGDKLVGIAFQTLEEGEGIGFMIASPVISHFLKDVASGTHTGFPDLGAVFQPLESLAHREVLGLPADGGGILVMRTAFGGSTADVLKPGDVLLGINGERVYADGTVPLREGELVGFEYIVSQHQVGETVELEVLRNGETGKGEILNLEVTLKAPRYLVADNRSHVRPNYFVFGGLLFTALTRNYLRTWTPPWYQNAPRDLMVMYEQGLPTKERQEPVVLQKVLADRVNLGYHELDSVLIAKVDGEPVTCLADLVRLVENGTELGGKKSHVSFETAHGGQIVVDRKQAKKDAKDMLKRFGVPVDRFLNP